MEKSNPATNPHLSWTHGVYDEPSSTSQTPLRPRSTPNSYRSLLPVARTILAALQPFPEAYRAVLHALRGLTALHPQPRAAPSAIA